MSNLIYKFLKLFQPVESSIDSSDNIIVESNIGTCNIIWAEKKKKYAKDKYYEHIKLSAIAYLVSTIVVIIMLILLDSIGEGAMAGFLKGGILWAPLIVVILIGAFFAAYSTYMDPLSDNGYFTKKNEYENIIKEIDEIPNYPGTLAISLSDGSEESVKISSENYNKTFKYKLNGNDYKEITLDLETNTITLSENRFEVKKVQQFGL